MLYESESEKEKEVKEPQYRVNSSSRKRGKLESMSDL